MTAASSYTLNFTRFTIFSRLFYVCGTQHGHQHTFDNPFAIACSCPSTVPCFRRMITDQEGGRLVGRLGYQVAPLTALGRDGLVWLVLCDALGRFCFLLNGKLLAIP